MDDVCLLVGLLCDGAEFKAAVAELDRQYGPRVRRFLSRLLPFCDEAEILRETENVLAQFTIAVQSGAVPDESAICPVLIKGCRRRAADFLHHIAGASSGGSVSGAARVRIRHALADITAGEKVVLREMLRTPEAPDLELFTAARATMPSMTLLDVVQARSRLTTRVKEVMDATQNHTG